MHFSEENPVGAAEFWRGSLRNRNGQSKGLTVAGWAGCQGEPTFMQRQIEHTFSVPKPTSVYVCGPVWSKAAHAIRHGQPGSRLCRGACVIGAARRWWLCEEELQELWAWAVTNHLVTVVSEQQERAFTLGLAGLLGEGVFNFGELVS